MERLRIPMTILCIFVLFAFSGCSIRPKDGLIYLSNDTTQANPQNSFELKNVTIQKLITRTLLGWQGNDLMVYDNTGIYLLDYRSSAQTPLISFTNKNSGVMLASLSNNGKKIFFSVARPDGNSDQYISDSDCKTNEINLSNMFGPNAFAFIKSVIWSNGGKYLFSPVDNGVKGYNILNANSINPVMPKINFETLATIYDIDDQSNQLLISRLDGHSYAPTLCLADYDGSIQNIDPNSYAVKASFISKNVISFLSGNTLSILNTTQPNQKLTYDGINSYAISSDKNYICLIKSGLSGSSDVYVGVLRNGAIANLSLLYKSADATVNGIYISPDDKRIGISANKTTSVDNEILVLTFQ